MHSPGRERCALFGALAGSVSCMRLEVLQKLLINSGHCYGLSAVDALMGGEGRSASKGLPTLRALVGSLSCVDALVADEVGTPSEALPTLRALVGSLPCVDALVAD